MGHRLNYSTQDRKVISNSGLIWNQHFIGRHIFAMAILKIKNEKDKNNLKGFKKLMWKWIFKLINYFYNLIFSYLKFIYWIY